MQAHVVIGANFGDEGKGATTAFLASDNYNSIVIRHNGGCQAGHTVQLPDGRKHVFNSFGSGALHGVPTYWAPTFIVNPLEVVREQRELTEFPEFNIGTTSMHPLCPITTPFDILLNWASENKKRDNGKHDGSCGLGIHETVVRHEVYPVRVMDITHPAKLRQRLENILSDYVPKRLAELGCEDMLDPLTNGSDLIDDFMKCCHEMECSIHIKGLKFLQEYDNLIFEGAQGLLLDQEHEWFPHVTHSNTGMKNVVKLISAFRGNVMEINVYYVTRPYLTRHGAGPLPHEYTNFLDTHPDIVDDTNISNHFQEHLRFAPFNFPLFERTTNADYNTAFVELDKWTVVRRNTVVTCLNHMPEKTQAIVQPRDGSDVRDIEIYTETLLNSIDGMTPDNDIYVSPEPGVFTVLDLLDNTK